MTHFPEDHAVAALQGYPYPRWARVKRACARRCAWLGQKIARRTATGEPTGLILDELASVVWLVEETERRRAGWRRGAAPCGVPCLVTVTSELGDQSVVLAVASLDGDSVVWSAGGSRLSRVLAWMPVPEAAEPDAEPEVAS